MSALSISPCGLCQLTAVPGRFKHFHRARECPKKYWVQSFGKGTEKPENSSLRAWGRARLLGIRPSFMASHLKWRRRGWRGPVRSSVAYGRRPTTREGDVFGTTNRFRSYGPGRCLAFSHEPLTCLTSYTYWKGLGRVETRGETAKGPVRQVEGKNGGVYKGSRNILRKASDTLKPRRVTPPPGASR